MAGESAMSEVWLSVGDRNVITVRLEPNNVQGRDMAGQPSLFLPMQLQLLPGGEKKDLQYQLVRLAGKVQSQAFGELASFDVGPIALVPNPEPFFRQQEAFVAFGRQQIDRFEDSRAGKDAYFQIMLTGTLWYPAQQRFEVTRPSSGFLELSVPRSQWIDKVLSVWNLSHTRIIELKFPGSSAGENFRNSYARVEEAERLYASAQYKQVLTTLRLAFEGLAKSFGFPAAGKDFFDSVFISSDTEKREKAANALTHGCKFFHLGPHEQAGQPNSSAQPGITRQDARFALTLAQTIFEYITPDA
jgi:hypothetical protein